MPNYGYIYKTTNLLNNKVYVGQKHGEFDPTYFGSGKILKYALNKYGVSYFRVEFMAQASSKSELDKLEEVYITEARKSLGCGNVYNICPGGTGVGSGSEHPNFGKKMPQISIALKGRKFPEHSRTVTGSGNPFYGRKFTEEQRKKRSIKFTGEGNSMYGKHHTEDVKKGMSITRTGEGNAFFGKHHTNETKLRLKELHLGHKGSTKWVNEVVSSKEKLIKKEMLPEYLNSGWSLGRLK